MACLMSVLMLLPHWLPQHLVQWDAGNPECLLQLVKELIQQYHHYQCQRLRESSRLLFEYDSLLEDPDYGRNMEIYAGRKNSWVGNCFMTLGCIETKSPVIVSYIPQRIIYSGDTSHSLVICEFRTSELLKIDMRRTDQTKSASRTLM